MARDPLAEDPFYEVRAMTDNHRATHGCWAYPFANGSLLGVLSGAARAGRILELGTGLGYSALWLAAGAPEATIDTVEQDPEHAYLAQENIKAYGFLQRVKVRVGEFNAVLSVLDPGYDLIFFDGFAPDSRDLVHIHRLLRAGGLLISANLNLSGPKASDYRAALYDSQHWITTIVNHPDDTALSLRRWS